MCQAEMQMILKFCCQSDKKHLKDHFTTLNLFYFARFLIELKWVCLKTILSVVSEVFSNFPPSSRSVALIWRKTLQLLRSETALHPTNEYNVRTDLCEVCFALNFHPKSTATLSKILSFSAVSSSHGVKFPSGWFAW